MEEEISNSFQTNSKEALLKTVFQQNFINFYPIHKENLHLTVSLEQEVSGGWLKIYY